MVAAQRRRFAEFVFADSGNALGADFRAPILQCPRVIVYICHYKMYMFRRSPRSGSLFSVTDRNVDPLAIRIELAPSSVRTGEQFRLRAVPAGIDCQVMEGSARLGPIAKHLHIMKDAFKINGHGVSDFEDFDFVVLGLEEMRDQCGAVRRRPAVFRRGDNHLRLSGA